MYQGMGWYICFADMLYLLSNPNLVHILDDSLNKDHPGIQLCTCIHRCCIPHSVHMVKGCKDLQRRDHFLYIKYRRSCRINLSRKNRNLRGGGAGRQLVKGSPMYRSGQVQIGVWLTTLHMALSPHDPGHGSIHFSRIHALLLIHSELIVHSCLQFGGAPI